MDASISNFEDLRTEIERLKLSKKIQESAIASHFKSPSAIFHTITALFKGTGTSPGSKKGIGSLLASADMVSMLSRVALPFILNKTIFRSSNFIIKAAVGLLSQKASGFINQKNVTSVWSKIKSLLPQKKAFKKRPSDYESALLQAKVY